MGYWGSHKGLLVGSFLLLLINLQSLKADEDASVKLIDEIQEIMDMYLSSDKPPMEFLGLISAEIDQTYEASGRLSFKPKLAALEKSYLRFRKNPEYLHIRIRPGQRPLLAELASRWGDTQTLIRGPSDPYSSEIFPSYKKEGFHHAARIVAFITPSKQQGSEVVELKVAKMPLSTTTEKIFQPTLETLRKKEASGGAH